MNDSQVGGIEIIHWLTALLLFILSLCFAPSLSHANCWKAPAVVLPENGPDLPKKMMIYKVAHAADLTERDMRKVAALFDMKEDLEIHWSVERSPETENVPLLKTGKNRHSLSDPGTQSLDFWGSVSHFRYIDGRTRVDENKNLPDEPTGLAAAKKFLMDRGLWIEGLENTDIGYGTIGDLEGTWEKNVSMKVSYEKYEYDEDPTIARIFITFHAELKVRDLQYYVTDFVPFAEYKTLSFEEARGILQPEDYEFLNHPRNPSNSRAPAGTATFTACTQEYGSRSTGPDLEDGYLLPFYVCTGETNTGDPIKMRMPAIKQHKDFPRVL